ncbi:phage protein [Corynebacterium kutscheri]|uniref:Phage protein n=1 Tax=Corynebacterium kutscheri TaxID=35755 RepID=A0A0F6TE27_9CORY|nr:hypothetical protein [Corynebacterium kutscheri]AKE42069.1 hypothetical protein UL82_09660 [Corynebacterium kutscheri]VEH06049.1 phage protein [Corynebacterium kutscheri]VEH10411.1 phage protein [Corynebacterium kutscheri]VEH81955.1 phage protein [Corynebacterium kutscheri]
MAENGTNRGGRRVRASCIRPPYEKYAKGKPATYLRSLQPVELDIYDFIGKDMGDGAELTGSFM